MAATPTPRLGLLKPAPTDNVSVAQLNQNADTIDASPGTFICTSTTRPAAPFSGQFIYETDTKKKLVYDGTAWLTIADGNLAFPANFPYAADAGSVAVSGNGTNTSDPAVITFPAGLFTATPGLTLASINSNLFPYISAINSVSATVYYKQLAGANWSGNYVIRYIAMQATA